MLFDINSPVDLGSKAVTHSVDELKFAVKNSLPYNGLLSNYHAISNKGWPTTNGEQLSLESLKDDTVTFKHRDKEYKITDAKQVLASKTKIELPFDEEIKDYYIKDDDTVYVRTEEHIFRLVDGKCEVAFNIEKNSDGKYKSCFFTVNKDGIFWYDNAFWNIETLEVIKETNFKFYDEKNEKIKEEPNNGYYAEDYWICGHDSTDHSKDWAENMVGQSIDYIGHITSTGEAIGEPRPDYLKPTILDNKLIKWDRFSEDDLKKLKETNIAKLSSGDEPILSSSTASFGAEYKTPSPIKYSFTYGMNRAGAFMYMEQWAGANAWQMVDTVASPGVYWQTEEDDPYTAIFPNASVYTNNIDARGRDYEYSGDWLRCIFNYRTWKITSSVFSIFSTPVTLFTYKDGKTTTVTLDNVNAQAIKKTGKLGGWAVPTPNSDGTFNIANSTVWFKFNKTDKKWLKHHLFSKAQASNRAWSSWRNTADFKVNDFPMFADIGDGYKVHLYQNLPICISKNNIAITTPTTEMDSVYAAKGNILVANKSIFRFEDITIDNIEVEKIADYKFKTNIVAPLNLFAEKRDGVIELAHSFVPYFNEVKWNGYGSLALLQCPDGNDYNDTFSMGFGINATLDDNITETSALLPAIGIPFYCNSRNIDAFNRQIIDKNAPIMIPDTACIPKDVALGVFFTHSLKSTDISYRYSEKNGEIYHDDKYDNTQWWIGSTSIFLPLGLGSTFSGINYLASTVELPGNYSVRLYTQNNNSFLLYNITQQSYYGQTIFTIYGSSYYYDSQGIYYIGDGSSNEFVCYAIGMKFLANSGTEAYFYSPVDKYLYTFTGSNTLTKAVPLSNVPEIKDAVFSSVDQTLFLLFEDDTLYAQNGISSAYFTNFTGIKELQGTTKGCSIIETSKSFHILNPEEGEVIPLHIETEYTGSDDAVWQCSYVDLMLYNNGSEVDFTVEVDMMGTENQSVKKNIHLKKSDFKNDYCKVRVSPKVNNGQGFKVALKSSSKVSIMSIAPKIERISDAGFAGVLI